LHNNIDRLGAAFGSSQSTQSSLLVSLKGEFPGALRVGPTRRYTR